MKDKKIGLALGGGAVLGAAHIGVLRALEERDFEIEYIAGTSIGAFAGLFYAYGMKVDEIEKIARKLRWMDIGGIGFSRMGLLDNGKLGALITEHLGECLLEDTKIPFAAIATNIANGEKVVLREGDAKKAVMASTCIPGIFTPIEINGLLLVDGGIVENVPVSTVKNMGASHVIGVDLNSGNKYDRPKHVLGVIVNSFHFMLKTATHYETKKADLLISPDLGKFDMIDTGQVDDLIRVGYESAVETLDRQ